MTDLMRSELPALLILATLAWTALFLIVIAGRRG